MTALEQLEQRIDQRTALRNEWRAIHRYDRLGRPRGLEELVLIRAAVVGMMIRFSRKLRPLIEHVEEAGR